MPCGWAASLSPESCSPSMPPTIQVSRVRDINRTKDPVSGTFRPGFSVRVGSPRGFDYQYDFVTWPSGPWRQLGRMSLRSGTFVSNGHSRGLSYPTNTHPTCGLNARIAQAETAGPPALAVALS